MLDVKEGILSKTLEPQKAMIKTEFFMVEINLRKKIASDI